MLVSFVDISHSSACIVEVHRGIVFTVLYCTRAPSAGHLFPGTMLSSEAGPALLTALDLPIQSTSSPTEVGRHPHNFAFPLEHVVDEGALATCGAWVRARSTTRMLGCLCKRRRDWPTGTHLGHNTIKGQTEGRTICAKGSKPTTAIRSSSWARLVTPDSRSCQQSRC
jgi:hypothetical protein